MDSILKVAGRLKQTCGVKLEQGFTLIETLIASFLIMTVILGLLGMMTTLMQSNSTNEYHDKAIDLAQDKVEELKMALPTSFDLSDLNTGNNANLESTTDFDHQQGNINEFGIAGGIYTRTWNIADDNPTTGMKLVVTIVSWTDSLGPHSVKLKTIL